MIFRLFKKKPTAEDQLRDFIDRLSQSPAEDLGLAVATVEHTANAQFIYGDFYKPQAVLKDRPEVIQLALLEAQRLQASGLEVLAVGWIVWLHTFRAIMNPELTPLAKSMWTLLVRGAPYAIEQIDTLVPLIGFELQVENPERVPLGFE
ncbi:MAG: hypothetical protein KDJ69_15330 [Nitratireductor sp.]|nr:hypothetical protein [Nitratireductor sp.]